MDISDAVAPRTLSSFATEDDPGRSFSVVVGDGGTAAFEWKTVCSFGVCGNSSGSVFEAVVVTVAVAASRPRPAVEGLGVPDADEEVSTRLLRGLSSASSVISSSLTREADPSTDLIDALAVCKQHAADSALSLRSSGVAAVKTVSWGEYCSETV